MNAQLILNLPINKTQKIRKLLELGFTRKEVAELMGVGYGFVQNVFAKYFPDQVGSRAINTTSIFSPSAFTRKFGIEIEAFFTSRGQKGKLKEELERQGVACNIEGYNHNTSNAWKIITDSSLRNTQNHSVFEAFEIVSPPIIGQNGLDQLKIVCDTLTRLKAKINCSTGLHIHFEAINFELQTWKNLYHNYAKYESAIDLCMPRSRRLDSNQYCGSINNSNTLRKVEQSTSVDSLVRGLENRYKKINAQSFLRHKTVEFRHHSGTVEFEKIKNWIYFLHHLVDFSSRTKTQNRDLDSMNEFLPTEIHEFYKTRMQTLNLN